MQLILRNEKSGHPNNSRPFTWYDSSVELKEVLFIGIRNPFFLLMGGGNLFFTCMETLVYITTLPSTNLVFPFFLSPDLV